MLADVVAIPTNGLILFGIGALIPPVTATLTKWHAPDWLKKVGTALLAITAAAVAEGIQAMQSGHDWTFYGVFLSALITWLAANVTYVKLWQNTPLMDAVVRKTADFGISAKAPNWPFPEPKPTDLPVVPAVEVAPSVPAPPAQPPMPAQLTADETRAIIDHVLQGAVTQATQTNPAPTPANPAPTPSNPALAADVNPVQERPQPPTPPIAPQPAPNTPNEGLNKSIMGFPGR